MTAPASGRTADENELRTEIIKALNAAFRGFSFPGGRWSTGFGSEMAADALLSGPLAPILQEAAHLRAENANLRDRVREAEGAGRGPSDTGSHPTGEADTSSSSLRDVDPSRALWPSGCIKPNSCSRHRQCMYAQSPKQCQHLGKDLTSDIEAAEARHAR